MVTWLRSNGAYKQCVKIVVTLNGITPTGDFK